MGVLDFVSVERPPTNSCENLRYRGVVTVKWRQFVVSETRCAWKMPGNHLVPLNGIFILHTWFQKLFKSHPYLGNGSNLTNMLQTGWNHQLVASISLILLFLAIFLPLSRGTFDKCMFYTFINGLTGMTQHHTGLNFQNMWPLWQWQMAIRIYLMDSYFPWKLTYTSISRWMVRRSISC